MTNELERDMRQIARELYDLQVAYIFKVPEEMQQTPCDFFGHTPTGRAIMIECKQVNNTILQLGKGQAMSPHQWIALKQAHQCGVLSFLIWRRGRETALVPFSVCIEALGDRKSIPWTAIAGLATFDLRAALIAALG